PPFFAPFRARRFSSLAGGSIFSYFSSLFSSSSSSFSCLCSVCSFEFVMSWASAWTMIVKSRSSLRTSLISALYFWRSSASATMVFVTFQRTWIMSSCLHLGEQQLRLVPQSLDLVPVRRAHCPDAFDIIQCGFYLPL